MALRQAAAEHRVELRNADQQSRQAAGLRASSALSGTGGRTGPKTSSPPLPMRNVCRPGCGGLTAHLADLHLAHHRVALHALVQTDQPVRDGEHRVGLGSRRGTRRSGRSSPAQLVISSPSRCRKCCMRLCALPSSALARTIERNESTKTNAGECACTSAADVREHPLQVPGQRVVGQADEMDRLVDLGGVEEVELLLVTQHLQRRLAQHGEVDRRALGRGHRRT